MIIQGDCIEELKKLEANSVDAIITDPPYGLEFMGKKWDGTGIAFKVETWKEALRVLKPGAYLLSFGGTRTYHRMVCGIEDAGFEIRDCIMWLYGSGFPKSLNIGKQIDKIQGNEREDLGENPYSYKRPQGNKWANAGFNNQIGKDNITKGNSEWEGWGTALKPACEPIVVARKPLSEKNVALNVLKWGTGGINIDACRIGTETRTNSKRDQSKDGNWGMKEVLTEIKNYGRFPANIILDEEAGRLLDQQAPLTGAFSPVKSGQKGFGGVIYGKYKQGGDDGKTFHNEPLQGASRFFYCAKASKSERNFGCEEFEDIKGGSYEFRQNGSLDGKIPINKNNHPTVKPIKLMEYLIKLVSKEEATILDPFMGSGTTGIACAKLNRKFIGIEKEEDYIKIAEARIKGWEEKLKKQNMQQKLI